MKTPYSCTIIIALCLMMGACSVKPPFTKWTHTGYVSGTIWYTPTTNSPKATATMPIPLLVHAEWETTPVQKGNLALVFLYGGLFAKCQYDNSQFICETKSAFPGSTAMAYDCAMLVSSAINDLQGRPISLDMSWDFTIQSEQDKQGKVGRMPLRIYSMQNNKTSIRFEITEATWR